MTWKRRRQRTHWHGLAEQVLARGVLDGDALFVLPTRVPVARIVAITSRTSVFVQFEPVLANGGAFHIFAADAVSGDAST